MAVCPESGLKEHGLYKSHMFLFDFLIQTGPIISQEHVQCLPSLQMSVTTLKGRLRHETFLLTHLCRGTEFRAYKIEPCGRKGSS